MKQLYLCLIGLLALLSACSKTDMSAAAEGGGSQLSGTPVGAVMSMENLQKAALRISSSSATKSAKIIKEVVPLKDYIGALETVKTRSAGTAETLPVENVYVVNYENDEGYAILSADTRTDMVLAYSDQGNMDENRLENPAFREYVELIPVYMEAATASLDSESMGYYGPVDVAYKTDEILSHQSPLLTATEWDQGAPLNDRVPVCNATGEHMPLGCVPTAVLQIMRYWQHPASYQSYSLGASFAPMWTSYLKDSGKTNWGDQIVRDNVSRLAYDVAKACQISFGCEGSGSDIYKAANALSNFGYRCDMIGDYNIKRVMEDIRNGRPVYMRGKAQTGEGHAWVLDGEQWFKWKYDVYLTQFNQDGSTQWQEYKRTYYDDGVNQMFHVNWGWGNGYNVYTNPNVYKLASNIYGSSSWQIIRNLRPN